MVSDYTTIKSVLLPRTTVLQTQAWLSQAGRQGDEAFVLWCGRFSSSDTFTVTEPLFPAQTPLRTPTGVGVYVDGSELGRLGRWLFQNRLVLLAQVHAHPGAAYHSDTDDTFPMVTTIGQLSVVVPNFARKMESNLSNCAVFRLDRTGRWASMAQGEIISMFRTV